MDEDTAPEEPREQGEVALVGYPGRPSFPLLTDEGGETYLPVRALCRHLDVAPEMQLRRIKDHAVLARYLRRFRLRSARGGPQATSCLALRAVGFWLGTIDAQRVRAGVRENLIAFQEELVRAAQDLLTRGAAPPGAAVVYEAVRALRAQAATHDQYLAELNRFVLGLADRTGRLEDLAYRAEEDEL